MNRLVGITYLCLLCLALQGSAQDALQSFVPLRTTRNEVEKVLGQPLKTPCQTCSYRSTEGAITVSYSEAPCVGLLRGWNVRSDVVLYVSVNPKETRPFSDYKLEKERLIVLS